MKTCSTLVLLALFAASVLTPAHSALRLDQNQPGFWGGGPRTTSGSGSGHSRFAFHVMLASELPLSTTSGIDLGGIAVGLLVFSENGLTNPYVIWINPLIRPGTFAGATIEPSLAVAVPESARFGASAAILAGLGFVIERWRASRRTRNRTRVRSA